MTLRFSFCIHRMNVINWYLVETRYFLCPHVHLLFLGRPKPDWSPCLGPQVSYYDYVMSWALTCLGSKGFTLSGEYTGSGYLGNKAGLASTHLQNHEVGRTRGMQLNHFFMSWVSVYYVCVCA